MHLFKKKEVELRSRKISENCSRRIVFHPKACVGRQPCYQPGFQRLRKWRIKKLLHRQTRHTDSYPNVVGMLQPSLYLLPKRGILKREAKVISQFNQPCQPGGSSAKMGEDMRRLPYKLIRPGQDRNLLSLNLHPLQPIQTLIASALTLAAEVQFNATLLTHFI